MSIGHDGTTIGESAFLDLFPERGIALAVLGNSSGTAALAGEVRAAVAAELSVVPSVVAEGDASIPVEVEDVVGDYESATQRFEVRSGSEGLSILLRPLAAIGGVEAPVQSAPVQSAPSRRNGRRRVRAALLGQDVELARLDDQQ